jgi:dihydroxy-acid dehydratase
MPLLLQELKPLLNLGERTVTGQAWGEILDRPHSFPRWQSVVRPLAEPLQPAGALIALRGSLAPSGAVIKRSAATPELLNRVGRAVVFTSLDDLAARIDSPDLDVTPDDFLVLQNAGPLGAPGMPEAGYLPIPKKLAGVKDMVRISDARMSGTAFGTVVLHISPEAAAGGPLGLVRDGDRIELSVERRELNLLVDEAELDRRRAEAPPPAPPPARGYERLYLQHTQQAHLGADFDFLRHPDLQG